MIYYKWNLFNESILMKINKTSLFERQSYKFANTLSAKKQIYDLEMLERNCVLEFVPELLVAEQKLYKSLFPKESKEFFNITMSNLALKNARAMYGKESVTKVVKSFFSTYSAMIMRAMQESKLEITEDMVSNYMYKLHRASLRQQIPEKIRKTLS